MSLGSTRTWWLLALLYTAITFPVVSPLIDYRHLPDASYEGDARLLIWTLAWDATALLTGAPLFDANMFYPVSGSLAWAEHHVGIALFALPVYAATDNAVLAYWTVWLLSFPLNALAMYALAWRITRDHAASFVSGLIFAFCFFRMHHAHGHLQLLWTWPLPLVPLALQGWLERPTATRALALTALILLQALSSWYLAVFVALLAAMSLIVLAPGTTWTRRHTMQAIGATSAGILVLSSFALPYFGLVASEASETIALSADAKAYLMPPENTWIGQWLLRRTSWQPRWIWGEQTIAVGMATMLAAAYGISKLRRYASNRLVAAVILSGLLALALSFGPAASGWAPFDLLARLPGIALLRAPARFAVLVMMAVALLAACGLASSRRWWITAALAMAVLAESFVVGFPGGRPDPLPIPPVYRQLASLSPGAVVSLPSYRGTQEGFREADYLLFSTAHWRPIVNGSGRQEPPGHGEIIETLSRFPAAEAVARMRDLGVRYVVLHTGRATGLSAMVSAARTASGVELIGNFDGDFLYLIRSVP